MRWIDVLDFVKTYDAAFAPGFRFQPSDILVRLKLDAELKEKLGGLKKYTGKEKHDEILDKILNDLKRDGFIEMENEITSFAGKSLFPVSGCALQPVSEHPPHDPERVPQLQARSLVYQRHDHHVAQRRECFHRPDAIWQPLEKL